MNDSIGKRPPEDSTPRGILIAAALIALLLMLLAVHLAH